MSRLLHLVLLLLASTAAACHGAGSLPMVRLEFQGRTVEGMLLDWNNQSTACLLARDGRMWQPKTREITAAGKSADPFQPMTAAEMRSALLAELGQDFDVTGTGHYLVAHPRGQGDLWAQRFEDLYRSLVHYFSVRGFQTTEPAFPLVGIVCRDQAEFARLAAADGQSTGGGLAGYYHVATNRIILCDATAASRPARDWRANAALVIHEATHQTAFNVGIHNRFAPAPRWVGEGLALLFEAPGVSDSQRNLSIADRVNRQQLAAFLRLAASPRTADPVREIVVQDRLFNTSPGPAYAQAWALTFYLTETQPGKYAEYLQRTARRTPFHEYSASQRFADFTGVFGDDWPMLEAQVLRFLNNPELSGVR